MVKLRGTQDPTMDEHADALHPHPALAASTERATDVQRRIMQAPDMVQTPAQKLSGQMQKAGSFLDSINPVSNFKKITKAVKGD